MNFYLFIISMINALSAELNPICHSLALLGAHHILHVSRIRVTTVQDINFMVPEVQNSVVTGKGEGAVVPVLAMNARITSEGTAPLTFNLKTRRM
jgi:hypothetical protein